MTISKIAEEIQLMLSAIERYGLIMDPLTHSPTVASKGANAELLYRLPCSSQEHLVMETVVKDAIFHLQDLQDFVLRYDTFSLLVTKKKAVILSSLTPFSIIFCPPLPPLCTVPP